MRTSGRFWLVRWRSLRQPSSIKGETSTTSMAKWRHLARPRHRRDAIIVDRLPNGHLEIVERAGHNAHDEQAAAVIAIVRDFMGRVGSSSPPPIGAF